MKKILSPALALIMLFIFCGCGLEREYYDNISIPLEKDNSVIIKEWSFLLESGAEIYCFDGDKEILLGQLPGGDDGFCPFKEGLYHIAVEGNELTIEWCSIPGMGVWNKKTFELPED